MTGTKKRDKDIDRDKEKKDRGLHDTNRVKKRDIERGNKRQGNEGKRDRREGKGERKKFILFMNTSTYYVSGIFHGNYNI